MQNHWPTKENDIKILEDLARRYLIEETEADPVEVKFQEGREKITVILPAWVNELTSVLKEQYGHEYGQIILNKVITHYILRHVTIH